LVCLAALAGSFVYGPYVHGGPALCVSRALVGLPCPGCGLTRSFCALARGDVVGALRYHVFGPLVYVLFVSVSVLWSAELLRGRRLWVWPRWLWSMRVGYVAGAILGTYHAARLVVMAGTGELAALVRESLAGTVAGWAARLLT
jgi:hypothetical protein